ncbi:hypothetical protein ABKN59_009845 [Abortiporus biennis]
MRFKRVIVSSDSRTQIEYIRFQCKYSNSRVYETSHRCIRSNHLCCKRGHRSFSMSGVMRQSRPSLGLNFDILFLVMKELGTRREVLSVMMTCKSLHHFGLRIMLRFPISFDEQTTDSSQPPYHRSLWTYLQNHPSSLKLIKSVEATSSSSWEDNPHAFSFAIKAFKILFEQCHNLERITFGAIETYRELNDPEDQPDVIVDEQPHFPRMILPIRHTFQHLRSLQITRTGPDTYLMLKGLTAPLVYLSISFDLDFEVFPNSDDYPRDLEQPRDPVPLLSNFQSTLEEVEVFNCSWQYEWGPDIPDVVRGIHCPRVHTLRTSDKDCGNTATLMYVFPNLKHLRVLDTGEDYSLVSIKYNMVSLEWLEFLGDRVGVDFFWSALEELTGDIHALWSLGLSATITEISRLELSIIPSEDIHDPEWVFDILESIQPRLMRITIHDAHVFFLDCYEENPAYTMQMFQFQTVDRLSLCLMFGSADEEITREMFSKFMDITVEIVSNAAASTTLQLTVTWPGRYKKKRKQSVVHRDNIQEYVESNQEGYMERILRTLLSLRYISTNFGLQNESWKSVRCWKVTPGITEGGTETRMHETVDMAQFEEIFNTLD